MSSLPLRLTLPNQKGPEVLRLQQVLGRHGFTIEADGVFGYSTERAVKEFQRKHGLKETGEVNISTSELLYGGSK